MFVQRTQRLCFLLLALMAAAPAAAVLGGTEPPPAVVVGDPDYKAGIAAFEQKDWPQVISRMARVIGRRPWDDNAHTLMGFAFRQLEDYPRAFAHYREALELNPHHRGALEYLGKTYLAMGQPERARKILQKLEVECRRLSAQSPEGSVLEDCQEWRILHAAITDHSVEIAVVADEQNVTEAWSAIDPKSSDELDTAALQVSDMGLYRVSFRSDMEPVTINRMHSWIVHVETLEGHPVEGASIAVSGGMPDHNHGLPTAPRMTRELGDGDYLIEGMKFQMNGWWIVSFGISTPRQADDVTFNLVL